MKNASDKILFFQDALIKIYINLFLKQNLPDKTSVSVLSLVNSEHHYSLVLFFYRWMALHWAPVLEFVHNTVFSAKNY